MRTKNEMIDYQIYICVIETEVELVRRVCILYCPTTLYSNII